MHQIKSMSQPQSPIRKEKSPFNFPDSKHSSSESLDDLPPVKVFSAIPSVSELFLFKLGIQHFI